MNVLSPFARTHPLYVCRCGCWRCWFWIHRTRTFVTILCQPTNQPTKPTTSQSTTHPTSITHQWGICNHVDALARRHLVVIVVVEQLQTTTQSATSSQQNVRQPSSALPQPRDDDFYYVNKVETLSRNRHLCNTKNCRTSTLQRIQVGIVTD